MVHVTVDHLLNLYKNGQSHEAAAALISSQTLSTAIGRPSYPATPTHAAATSATLRNWRELVRPRLAGASCENLFRKGCRSRASQLRTS